MIELLVFIFVGCLLGTLTGSLPGLHVNNLALLLLLFFPVMPPNIIALIVAMAVTHTFFDFLPSILFGVPDSETYLSVLPAHRMLLQGRGYEALLITIASGAVAGMLAIIFAPLFILALPKISQFLPRIIPLALFALLVSMILFSKNRKSSLTVVALSSALGVVVLKNLAIENGLSALIIGFFSLSMLTLSLLRDPKIFKQRIERAPISGNAIKGSFLALFGSSTIAIMPSIGPGQAAFILSKFFGKMDEKTYLAMLGGINTANLIFSLFVLYALGKVRSGIALAISNIDLQAHHLLLLSGCSLLAIAFSVVALKLLGKYAMHNIHRIPYRRMNLAILACVLVFVYAISGFIGLLASLTACFLAIYASLNNVRRSNCMAFLMVPTILFYIAW